jgi:hypothetical protein
VTIFDTFDVVSLNYNRKEQKNTKKGTDAEMKKSKESEIKESAEKEMLRYEVRELISETEDIELLRIIYLTLLKSR